MRVRALDIGGAGGGGSGVTDRVRRAILGEGAERKLRRELEHSPPDAAVVFDPHAALAVTVARDHVSRPAPVVAIVGELEPEVTWGQTAADRFLAIDDLAAVALAQTGVEAERILVVGAFGERAFAEAGELDRSALRTRFRFGAHSKLALVEVAGLGAETTGQLALQLSLTDAAESITFLFDAGNDADAASVLRRQVPGLGLTAKLFGATADAPLLWRVADVLVTYPSAQAISRAQLVGGKLVAVQGEGAALPVAALQRRGRATAANSLAMLSSAIDTAFRAHDPGVVGDGADCAADIVAAVAADKRAILDEHRDALHARTRAKVKVASDLAQAAASVAAMPGELEDLSNAAAGKAAGYVADKVELERLRVEVARRTADMTKTMVEARAEASELGDKAKAAMARGDTDAAGQFERLADAERARMHATLAELATLESELKALETAQAKLADMPAGTATPHDSSRARPGPGPRRSASGAGESIDDQLERLKRTTTKPSKSTTTRSANHPEVDDLDHELAALKRKMGQTPSRKKP